MKQFKRGRIKEYTMLEGELRVECLFNLVIAQTVLAILHDTLRVGATAGLPPAFQQKVGKK